jgi:Fe-S cluster biogenesis protein NfuA
MEENIKTAIENIRPFLQRDGGDLEFVAYTEEKIVQVKLKGACDGCPHAQMTIKNGVERILKEQYPEITGVEAV